MPSQSNQQSKESQKSKENNVNKSDNKNQSQSQNPNQSRQNQQNSNQSTTRQAGNKTSPSKQQANLSLELRFLESAWIMTCASSIYLVSECYKKVKPEDSTVVAQWEQQKNFPTASVPCPIILVPQLAQHGANRLMAHSKQSKICSSSFIIILNTLSQRFPQFSHLPYIQQSPQCRDETASYVFQQS